MTNPTAPLFSALDARARQGELDQLHLIADDVDARMRRLDITSDLAIRSGGHDGYLNLVFRMHPELDPGLHRAIENALHATFGGRTTGHVLDYAGDIAALAVKAATDYYSGRSTVSADPTDAEWLIANGTPQPDGSLLI